MTETSTSTILSDWLSEKINPYHLKAWLSLHFGKGRYNINGHFLEGVFNADGMPKKVYEIRAPREIREKDANVSSITSSVEIQEISGYGNPFDMRPCRFMSAKLSS
ncbi:hypothetical protein LA080_009188 [Diaporthe eres]|nr:hypothetical protein LA080_009188 [Diaporthe eres]